MLLSLMDSVNFRVVDVLFANALMRSLMFLIIIAVQATRLSCFSPFTISCVALGFLQSTDILE